jgi:hypothetical protein
MNSRPLRQFCTYFDSNYLLRGLALYHSLERHVGDFVLHVLCLDLATAVRLHALRLPRLRLVGLAELEQAEPGLPLVKPHRSRIEYYFTLTPAWIRYVLRSLPAGMLLTYLDADLLLFGDPLPAEQELADGSLLLVPHRFPPGAEQRLAAGFYNVGYLIFRRDPSAEAALDWWRDACLDWCEDRVDADRYADQGYLNQLPQRFAGVRVCGHPGINAAPWNIAQYRVSRSAAGYRLDDTALLVYHFHGLRRLHDRIYDSGLAFYGVEPSSVLLQLYGEYLQTLQSTRLRDLPFGAPRGRQAPRPSELLELLSRTPVLTVGRDGVRSRDLRVPAAVLLRWYRRARRLVPPRGVAS